MSCWEEKHASVACRCGGAESAGARVWPHLLLFVLCIHRPERLQRAPGCEEDLVATGVRRNKVRHIIDAVLVRDPDACARRLVLLDLLAVDNGEAGFGGVRGRLGVALGLTPQQRPKACSCESSYGADTCCRRLACPTVLVRAGHNVC